MAKFGVGIVAAIAVMAAIPAVAKAKPVGTIQTMPFFGLPYPFGYVYHRPNLDCYDFQTVQTLNGPVVQQTWKCETPVSAKY